LEKGFRAFVKCFDNPQHGKLQKFGPNEMKLITGMKINSYE
jgi:hypothetical protein